jgi:CRISPR-associated protein Cas2
MFVVVSYDISSDKRRLKVMKLLKNYGNHVQESVFECEMRNKPYETMRTQLAKLIAPREDNIRFYFLDEDTVKKIEFIGNRPVERMQPYRIVGRS